MAKYTVEVPDWMTETDIQNAIYQYFKVDALVFGVRETSKPNRRQETRRQDDKTKARWPKR